MNDAVHAFAAAGVLTIPDALEQERMVEALLFASTAPMAAREIAARLPAGCDVGAALDRLTARYAGRGVELVRVAGAWAFRTAADLGFLMSREVVEERRLSRAAIETLAIVAYHQPVTRAEIEEIRGVSVSRGTIDQLMELGWIRLGRRRESPGRPVTFVVTPAFLEHFGLDSPADLPGLAELRAAGLLDGRPVAGLPGQDADDPDDPHGPEEADAAAGDVRRPDLFG
jgi:segregation and condensation protein B